MSQSGYANGPGRGSHIDTQSGECAKVLVIVNLVFGQ